MELEPIKIKLKECCLTCEHFDPKGILGFGLCAPINQERVIACGHMEVCYKYLGKDVENEQTH